VPGASAGSYTTVGYTIPCGAGEVAVSSSCGYQIPTASDDEHNLNINYSGLYFYDANGTYGAVPTGAQCNVTNSASNSRNITVGVSCLATGTTPTTTVVQ
jgi:hypothetical protein